MSLHKNYEGMLQESLPEYIDLARKGIESRKENGGALGYPSATLLFAVVDTIGSHLRKRPGLQPIKVPVREAPQQRPIEKGHHFRALNSKYFGLNLSDPEIETLYELGRCPLVHNGLLGVGPLLFVNTTIPEVFEFPGERVHISLTDFLQRCERAVDQFLAEAEAILRDSGAIHDLQKKAKGSGDWGESAQASGIGPPQR